MSERPMQPSAPPGGAPTSRGRPLEILAFVVVYSVGTVLAAVALSGGRGSEAAAVGPSPRPSAEISGPTSAPPFTSAPPMSPSGGIPPFGDLVITTSANSNISNVGCRADLFFTWEIDLSTAPEDGRAVIELQGPQGSKDYTERLQGNTVTLRLQAPIPSPHAEWTASLLTVGGRPVIDTPLLVTVDDPTC